MGADSPGVSAVWAEGHTALLELLPQAEPYVLPQATHLLQWQNPGDLAAALAAFYSRHPLRR